MPTIEGAITPERGAVAAVMLAMIAPLPAAALAGAGLAPAWAFGVAMLAAAACWPWLARRLPRGYDGLRIRRPVLCGLWLVLGLAAAARLWSLAWFMADPAQAQASVYWFDPFYVGHSCFSSYWQAAELARAGVSNLYDPELYAGHAGRFKIDEFLYLPQFVLLPELALRLGADFLSLRAFWFALEGAIVLAGLWSLARWIGGGAGDRLRLLIPAVMVAAPTLITLQVGNFQLAAIALSVLAMVQFERGRNAAGGALLGLAALKLFPGLLGIYLLASRRWRAAAWTIGFSLLYTALTWAFLGAAPFHAFFDYQVPRIVSGEAWAFLEIPGLEWVSALNTSVPGLALKARFLGAEAMDRGAMGLLGWLWTLVVCALAVLTALRSPRMNRLERAAAWVALLGLASFRSPFLPDHSGLFAPLWVWALIAAAATITPRNALLLGLGWLACNVVLPVGGVPLPDVPTRIVLASVVQAIAIGLCLWPVLRRPEADRRGAGAMPYGSADPMAPRTGAHG